MDLTFTDLTELSDPAEGDKELSEVCGGCVAFASFRIAKNKNKKIKNF